MNMVDSAKSTGLIRTGFFKTRGKFEKDKRETNAAPQIFIRFDFSFSFFQIFHRIFLTF